MDSSPFIERPNSPLLRQKVTSLNFQLTDAENELKLAKLEHESKLQEITKQLKEQQLKNDSLSSDQIYYYNQNKELNSKITHLDENFNTERSQLQTEINQLRNQVISLKSNNEELHQTNQSLSSTASQLTETNSVEITNLRHSNDELIGEIDSKNDELTRLKTQLDEQKNRVNALEFQLQQTPSIQDIESVTSIKEQLSDQVSYIKELESKNLKQAEQIKTLKINNENIQVLKNDKNELIDKVAKLEGLNDVINDLNLENLNLQNEISRWKVYLDGDDDNVESFVSNYKKIKDDNLLLSSNYQKQEAELLNLKRKYNDLFIQNQSLDENHSNLISKYENLTKLNHELEQQKSLLFEESNFLREQLKSLDLNLSTNDKDKETYINNLEGLIEDYKRQINEQSQVQEVNSNNKRPKFDEDTTRTFQKTISSLETDNSKLETQLNKLSNDYALLLKKYESVTTINQQKIRILQLRNNPFNKDQFVKKSKLEKLTQENNNLVSKISGETIPKSVYDRVQLEISELEATITALTKKNIRLKEMFTSKSRDFITSIQTLLGYRLEFLNNDKVKIFPRLKTLDKEKNYLVIDLVNQTFKIYDNDEEFKRICNSLLGFWIKEKAQIPCFLAALTLELFEREKEI